MDCLKGMIVGIVLGMMAGAVVGSTNCELVHSLLKQGKREIKRFKRKMSI